VHAFRASNSKDALVWVDAFCQVLGKASLAEDFEATVASSPAKTDTPDAHHKTLVTALHSVKDVLGKKSQEKLDEEQVEREKRMQEMRQREQVRERMKRVKQSKDTDLKIKQIVVMKHEKVVPLEMRLVTFFNNRLFSTPLPSLPRRTVQGSEQLLFVEPACWIRAFLQDGQVFGCRT
jgi:hypothetical protein